MGFSPSVALKASPKPHKWGQETKHDSANPGVNAWASEKRRAIVFNMNEPTRELL